MDRAVAPRCRTIAAVMVALLLSVCSLSLRAQQDTGTISGEVVDSSGAVVVKAQVVIRSETTGIVQKLETNHEGLFNSPPLSVGIYNIEVTSPSFGKVVVAGVVLDAAERYSGKITLQPAVAGETVVVEAGAAALDTTDATVGAVIDSRASQELPLNGRNALALAVLTPGVTSGVGPTSEGFNDRGTQVSAIRISGGALGVNNVLLDAANNLQSYLGEVAINPKADAVSEFRIQSGVMSAQFGYTSGGVINIVTRSGGEHIHGSAYEYFRNDALDALNAFANTAIKRPELRYNQYGVTLGGPLRKHSLFYFGNYEEYRHIAENPSYGTVPTLQERGGDFSDLQLPLVTGTTGANNTCKTSYAPNNTPYVQIFDPTTGTGISNRSAYPGNKIPAGEQDPVALAIQNTFFPLPNNTTKLYESCSHANNFVTTARLHSSERQALGRVDWRLSSRNNIFARYAYYNNKTDGGGGLGVVVSGRNDELQNYGAVLGVTTLLTSTMVNEFRVSGLRSDFPFQAGSAGQNWPARLGLTGVPATTLPFITGPIVVGGGTPFNTTYGFRASTSGQIVDDVSKQFGRHLFHVGIDTHLDQAYNSQITAPSGSFSFTTNGTGFGSSSTISAGTGNAYASFLAGAATGATATIVNGTTFREYRVATYIQDDWKILDRLTLNLGIRYDYQQQPFELHNQISNFDITQRNSVTGYMGNTVYAGVNGYGRNFVRENYRDFSPRIGFAYQLPGRGQTILRGGYAIYYPTNANQNYALSAGSNNGFGTLATTYTSSLGNGIVLYLKDGLPYPANQPLGSAGGANAFIGQSGIYVKPDAKSSMSMLYTLTVSRQLPGSIVLDVSFLANHGVHFPTAPYNMNVLDPKYFYLGTAYLTGNVPNPYAGIPGSLGGATISRAGLLKPYPYMVNVTSNYPHDGTYSGNFLYVSAQRRKANGLQIIASYTLGKLITDPIFVQLGTTTGVTASSSGPGSLGAVQSIFNRRGDRGVDANDVTHRLSTAVMYNLPFGKGKRFLNSSSWLAHTMNGLQLNTIMAAETGRPIGIFGATNQSIANRPNYNPGVSPKLDHPTKDHWFNTQAFINPPDYTYGNVPRYDTHLRGPSALNFDMSLFKNIKLTHKLNFQFRTEAFNVFNKVNLNKPNSTFVAGPAADPANPYQEGGLNTSATFGQISSAQAARIIQLAGRFTF